MKKIVYCDCGSKKPKDFCCGPKVRAFAIPITGPEEQRKVLWKMNKGSQFDLRNRAYAEFYGDDLIQYKLEKPSCKRRNHFLMVFGKYLTDYLEDINLSSWQNLNDEFWEEFLIAYYPSFIQVTTEQNEVQTFLFELRKFVKWLDRNKNCRWYPIIDGLIYNFEIELKQCEQLINTLYLQVFPNIHKQDWDYNQNLITHQKYIDSFKDTFYQTFEVTDVNGMIATLTDIYTNRTYQVVDIPVGEKIVGKILMGTIGKEDNTFIWSWLLPQGVYPNLAKYYLKNVMLTPPRITMQPIVKQ